MVGGSIRVERGHVQFVDSQTVQVDGKRLHGSKVLIATGSRPVVPDIDGLDSVPYLTSDLLTVDESAELRALPASLLIVGGGYVALELAQMFSRVGTAVTMRERGRQLLTHGYEPEVGRSIGEVFAQEGIQVILNATARSVRQDGAETVTTAVVAGRDRQYRTERVLVATGRRPNSDNIAVGRAGVQVNERGEVIVDTHLRTNVAHIYAAGDVIGRQHNSQMATPVGNRQGGNAARMP